MYSELFKDLKNEPGPTHTTIGIGTKTGILPHFHSTSEFIHILEGGLSIATVDSVYPVSVGDIVMTSGGTPHATVDTIFPIKFIVCYLKVTNTLEDSDITKHLCTYHSTKQHIVHIFKAGTAQNKFVGDLMKNLLEEQTNKKARYTEIIDLYFRLINSFLLRERIIPELAPQINLKHLNKFLPVLDYINNNYNTALNVNEISSLFFLSRSHFEKLFKSATCMNFTEYINYVRIQNSKKLIKETSKSIGEIANSVGFSSQIYFCKCFKKFNFCTPNEYRHKKFSFDCNAI